MLAEALAGAGTAESARNAQTRESGEAQRATALRKSAETALRQGASELAESAGSRWRMCRSSARRSA